MGSILSFLFCFAALLAAQVWKLGGFVDFRDFLYRKICSSFIFYPTLFLLSLKERNPVMGLEKACKVSALLKIMKQ